MSQMYRILIGLLLFPTLVYATPITVAWDPNPPAENVVEYRIGECPQNSLDCVIVASTQGTEYTLDVPLSTTKCFRVVAVNVIGLSSEWSQEVCIQPTKPSPVNRWRVILYVPK